MRLHTVRLLSLTSALTSALGLVAGALTATAGPAAAADGPQLQAIVALAGDSAVAAPGVHVQTVLGGVHSEVVRGSFAALAQLAATPGVLGVEPNVSAHLESYSYAGLRADKNKHGDTSSEDVLAPGTLGGKAGTASAGKGVTVALIDTGVTDTAALNRASGRVVDAVDTSGLNSDTGSVVERGVFADGYGHGTFMASLIAGGKVDGSGDRGLGVAPGATVDVVKVADDQGNTSLAAVLAGLNWVATHSDHVDVANLSLGVDRPTDSYGIDPLNYAVTLTRDAGVTVVVAAGNTPGQVSDPGFDPAALTVGAADTTGNKPVVADFSGSGNIDGVSKPDVVAAGVNLLGEMPGDALIAQQFPAARQPSGLFRGSGTSQSTAIVSGLAALYLQDHHKASPQQVKSAIRDVAKSITAGSDGGPDGQGLVQIPNGHYSAQGTGEQSLNVWQWYATAAVWGPFWNDDLWDVRNWTARNWLARNWTARNWLARNWLDDDWAARNWLARNWLARNWAARNWAAASWGDAS